MPQSFSITMKPRIKRDYTVTFLDGFSWDAEDLITTLSEIGYGESYITSYPGTLESKLANKLVELKVLVSPGNRDCAAIPGVNFKSFCEELRKKLDEVEGSRPRSDDEVFVLNILRVQRDVIGDLLDWNQTDEIRRHFALLNAAIARRV